MTQPKPTFARLVQAVLDGTGTPEQHQQLGDLLRTNASYRHEYVQQMRLDALLHFTGGAVAKRNAATHPTRAAKRNFYSSPFHLIAAVAAILIIGGSALWWS